MSRLVTDTFVPARPWLTGNLQTVADRIRPAAHDLAAVADEERLLARLSDGSGEALAVRLHRPRRPAAAPPSGAARPIVLIVHGMGGTIDSTYVRATALGLLRAGYPVARVDLRGVGESIGHTRSLYHGGRTADLRDVLRMLAGERGADGVAIVGFSLGGNVSLKLLGEPLDGIPVRAGASVCAPLDLAAGVEHISHRVLGLYERFFVHRLRHDTLASQVPLTAQERAALRAVQSIVEFDDLITAKRNGWRDAADYYAVNSSAQFLPRITVPTLVVHALDDPMIPAASYEAVDWEALAATTPVRRAITATGGHCGFHEAGQELPWYVGRIRAFLDGVCATSTAEGAATSRRSAAGTAPSSPGAAG
jgi:predicted alpha/beta-fold hydrolase